MSTRPADPPVPPAAEPHQSGWAGQGFTRSGPSAKVPRDVYRAALQDALAYTTDRDGCGECDRDRLCPTHASRAARAEQYQQALEQPMEAGSWATQAVLDAIHNGRLRAELLEDCDFWAAKAAQQQMEADAQIDPGPTERQLEDWNIHNDHVDGLTADHDLDREP